MLYWRIGQRVRREILQEGRATYGDAIVVTLSRQLREEYGQGFSARVSSWKRLPGTTVWHSNILI
jgi:hypothetical protein